VRLVPGDEVTWEVTYLDGSRLFERMGATYADIDRDRLARFALVAPGETLLECAPPEGATGHHLIYRRRTAIDSAGKRSVVFLIAWAPMGPALLIDPGAGTAREEAAFIAGDPDMYPPEPVAGDGQFLLDNLASAT
jgi:hypothetical protein